MDPVAGVRRVAELADRPLAESDRVLVRRIATEIAERGPMTFDRFMEIALYDPERGYYATDAARTGRHGDFLTAPEAHPIFGRTLARTVGEAWRLLDQPRHFQIREDGAGSGALAAALLGGLRFDDSEAFEAVRYRPVEVNPYRMSDLRSRLQTENLEGHLLDPDAMAPRVGITIANEFLDALPVHRVEMRGGVLRELFVDMADEAGSAALAFIERPLPASAPHLAARLETEGVQLAEGASGEICLRIDDWAAALDSALDRGFAVVIDYGHPAVDLYGPQRAGGTLRVYSGHRVGSDPFVSIGSQDLTAHVDFTAVGLAFARVGWRVLGEATQAEFLVGSGMAEVLQALQADPATDLQERLLLRSAIGRMLDPRATGGFRVLVAAKGVPADATLAGLRHRTNGAGLRPLSR
jgi:SAM-dependent MidA family methyltransferase